MTGKELFEKIVKENKGYSLEDFVKLMQSVKWSKNKGELIPEYPMTNEELEKWKT